MTKDNEHNWLVHVGNRIRKIREARGLNLHELARLCGISASALSLIETGQRDLRISSLHRIAVALRVVTGDLLDGSSEAGDKRQSDTDEAGYDLGNYT